MQVQILVGDTHHRHHPIIQKWGIRNQKHSVFSSYKGRKRKKMNNGIIFQFVFWILLTPWPTSEVISVLLISMSGFGRYFNKSSVFWVSESFSPELTFSTAFPVTLVSFWIWYWSFLSMGRIYYERNMKTCLRIIIMV